ncbi:HAMP domain-containing sensor histidine kinase [Ruminococcus sp.]|uniref:sensor histidine kinase n=1 Tax=Ruminococcus sp. TaxID=41978 RepID=UPI0025EA4B50|nr:HAMP domain-containing sensor histidine kinase [Ruminococcus sp.]
MKRFFSVLLLLAILFATIAIGFDYIYIRKTHEILNSRNVTVNRINSEIEKLIQDKGEDPDYCIKNKIEEWKCRYGKSAPQNIVYIPLDGADIFQAKAESANALCTITGKNSNIIGCVEYTYQTNSSKKALTVINCTFIFAFFITAGFMLYIWLAVILPFRRLSDYPERLARLRDIQKLPESKSRYFGRYVWGMNMLSDVLRSSSNRIQSLECEHQKLVTSIAHGVNTPIANIRLYTDAIRTGLYKGEKKIEEIADKIDINTEKIETMSKDLIVASTSSCGGFDIEIGTFNIKELAKLIDNEYKDRMKMKRIPFIVECVTECIIESDKYALYRAVSQILENAVKYGDGSGIKVALMKADQGFYISVRNRGELLPEKELPYVFRSYWRGSNAVDKEGSGIGLYSVHETVKSLGGSVHARRIEETLEMEFIIFIEKI